MLLHFRAPPQAKSELLPIYSGFIDVINECDGRVSHLSCKHLLSFLSPTANVFADAGVVGDYHNARILVRNNPDGFISGLVGSEWNYISQGEVLNATAENLFPILLVTAWPSRIVFIEVVSGIDNVLPGFNPR